MHGCIPLALRLQWLRQLGLRLLMLTGLSRDERTNGSSQTASK